MPSNSLWLDGHQQKYKTLHGETKADVAIVGGGIAGLTTAYLLSAAGVNVAVLEARTICSGATGHMAAHFTSQRGLVYRKWLQRYGVERARLIAQANEGAISLAAGIVGAEEIDCALAPHDSYLFTNDAGRERELEAEAEAASKLGIMADMTNQAAFLFSYVAAVRFHRQASLHPVEYLSGLAYAITRNGGRIFEQSRAMQLSGDSVRTAEGHVRSKCTVVATSFPIVNIPGWYHLRMNRRRAYAAALEGAPVPAGIWSSCDRGGYTYRGQEQRLIVCGGDHRSGAENTTSGCDALRKDMLTQFPGATPTHLWSAQYADTVDGLPYIGKYSDKTPSMFVAAGFGRWGMAQGTLAGHILCDLVLDRKNPYAEIYSPQRPVITAAWGSALAMNLNTAWLLTSSAFRQKRPVCSHYGCRMVWNKDEGAWECPCHGSMFAEDGSVIDAPALKDIKSWKGP